MRLLGVGVADRGRGRSGLVVSFLFVGGLGNVGFGLGRSCRVGGACRAGSIFRLFYFSDLFVFFLDSFLVFVCLLVDVQKSVFGNQNALFKLIAGQRRLNFGVELQDVFNSLLGCGLESLGWLLRDGDDVDFGVSQLNRSRLLGDNKV